MFIFKIIIVFQIFTLTIVTSSKNVHEKPRCGKPETVTLSYPLQMTDNSSVLSIWPKREVSYKIRNVTSQLKKSDVQKVFKEAADKWTKHTTYMHLYETDKDNADIHVFFVPFNNNNLLGCADYPPGGMIFFNQDLNWSLSKNQSGYNFEWVVLHELGHSLGLNHINNKENVMYEEYMEHNLFPNDREINNLRKITNDKYSPIDKDTSALCGDETKIDALHYKDNIHIIMIKNQYWEFNRLLRIVKGPMEYEVNNTKLDFLASEGIDGAIKTFSGRDIFFKNNTAYKYNFDSCDYDKESLTSVLGNVASPIDDVINVAMNTYHIFKGEFVYITESYCNITYKKKIEDEWPGVPYNIDGATVMDDVVLFVKSDRYYISKIDNRRLNQTNTLKQFFKCNELDY